MHGWAWPVLALALTLLLVPPSALTFQVPDRAAIACGLASCACLVNRPGAPGRVRMAGAALWCVLSIAAKQTSILLPLAQIAFLWSEHHRTVALRYVAVLVVAGVAIGGSSVMAFGVPNLWLNLVEIPARIPWGDPAAKVAARFPEVTGQVVIPLLCVFLSRQWAHSEKAAAAARLLRCTRLVFLMQLPVGLLAFFKLGGDTNVLHSWYYLAPALVIAALKWITQQRAAPVYLAVGIVCVLVSRIPQFRDTPSAPLTAHLAHASAIARAFNGATWFPQNPLVSYYSDGRVYHSEDGIATRNLAGIGLREQNFRRFLPNPLARVVYPATTTSTFALQLLPEFTQRRVIGGWAVFSR